MKYDLNDFLADLDLEHKSALTYNPDCEKCAETKKHCEECPSPKCESCQDIGEFCGYCDFGQVIDHAEQCEQKIIKEGLEGKYEVMIAEDNMLQIDCDTIEDVKFCMKRLMILTKVIKVDGYKITKSKSGNRHVIIKLDKSYNIYERIAMQACLGSDRMREILSLANYMKDHKNPIVLIESVRTKDEPWVELA